MEHHVQPPTSGAAPSLTFLNSPFAIIILTLAASTASGWIRDRLSTETRDTTSVVKIEALGDRVAALERGSLPAGQFREFQAATNTRLDEIRQDLRDIKRAVAGR